jgi:hypothetical protein
VDHDALYAVVRRLLATGKVVAHHVEVGSADVHRDVGYLKQALAEAEQLLNPVVPDAPDDTLVLYAHAVKVGDHLWRVASEGWAEVRGVHAHELYPERVQINVLRQGEPAAYGFDRTEPLVVRRRTPVEATPEGDQ